jgi:hypothetical protein
MKHLALFSKQGAEKILLGQKTIDARFFKGKTPPFGIVSFGDLVYIKVTGGEIIGQFRVKKVITMDGLDKEDLEQLKTQYGEKIAEDEKYWKSKQSSKFLTLIFVGQSLRFLTSPIKVPKKDKRNWIVLT